MSPAVGRIVQYRQKRGSQAWLPAVVTVTEDTFVPGVWVTSWDVVSEARTNHPSNDGTHDFIRSPLAMDGFRVSTIKDSDGATYRPSELPPPRDGRIHLRVLSPTCGDYAEFNVAQGDEPGCWRPIPTSEAVSSEQVLADSREMGCTCTPEILVVPPDENVETVIVEHERECGVFQ